MIALYGKRDILPWQNKEEYYEKIQRHEQRRTAYTQAQLDKEYADIKAKGLALDMSRGKPSADQLDLSMGLMNVLSSDSDLKCETGVDCRNYGVIDGIPEAKRLLGEMSEVDPDHIIIYGTQA